MNLSLFAMKQAFDEKFKAAPSTERAPFNYEEAERFHIIVQCLGECNLDVSFCVCVFFLSVFASQFSGTPTGNYVTTES